MGKYARDICKDSTFVSVISSELTGELEVLAEKLCHDVQFLKIKTVTNVLPLSDMNVGSMAEHVSS